MAELEDRNRPPPEPADGIGTGPINSGVSSSTRTKRLVGVAVDVPVAAFGIRLASPRP